MADSAVAIENMMLEAASINVGSCYVNQLRWLGDNEAVRNYIESLGLKENEIICGSIILGYSAQGDLSPLQRTGNQVTFVK